MHRQHADEPAAFLETYAARAAEAVRLADAADYTGYGISLPQCAASSPTALHFAAGCGCLEACGRLLARCGRLNFARDAAGRTPLCWASAAGLCLTAGLLLQHGAAPLHADAEGCSPLHLAAVGGFSNLCGRLLLALDGACVDLQDAAGQTPLHCAAAHGHSAVVQRLLKAGASPASRGPRGRTPLHLAAMGGHLEVMRCLLASAGPGVHRIEDEELALPLDHALEREHFGVAALLEGAEEAEARCFEKWRALFEPCRAVLNGPACTACLEIGAPRLVAVEHTALRLTCRVVDALGLLRRYTVEVLGEGPASVVPRPPRQRALDDLELAVPRRRRGEALWDVGHGCCLRVLGHFAPAQGRKAGVGGDGVVRSAWAQLQC